MDFFLVRVIFGTRCVPEEGGVVSTFRGCSEGGVVRNGVRHGDKHRERVVFF